MGRIKIEVRLTEEEKKQIIIRANKFGVSTSSYIRNIALNNKIVSKTDIQTVLELRKIGVNVNQLAKHINTLPTDENKRYAIERIKKYLEEIDKVINNLK